jgi:hypothetical protein
LGFSWGSHFGDKKYYFDLSAHYEFAFFWQQNMMRKLGDQIISGTGGAPGDLYLQGLAITACLHF